MAEKNALNEFDQLTTAQILKNKAVGIELPHDGRIVNVHQLNSLMPRRNLDPSVLSHFSGIISSDAKAIHGNSIGHIYSPENFDTFMADVNAEGETLKIEEGRLIVHLAIPISGFEQQYRFAMIHIDQSSDGNLFVSLIDSPDG